MTWVGTLALRIALDVLHPCTYLWVEKTKLKPAQAAKLTWSQALVTRGWWELMLSNLILNETVTGLMKWLGPAWFVLMPFLTLFMPYIGVNHAFMMIGSTTNRWAAESSPGHRAKKRGLLAFLRRVWYILHESPWAYPYDIWLMIWHILHHVCVCCYYCCCCCCCGCARWCVWFLSCFLFWSINLYISNHFKPDAPVEWPVSEFSLTL